MESANQLITFIALGVVLMLLLAIAFILFFSFSQNKFRKEQLKAQQVKLEYQERLLHSTLQTQEEERSRIAKDLHDDVGSKLNVIHLYLHQLAKKAPNVQNTVSEISDILNDTIQTSRRISHDLLPPTLEKFGLAAAIDEMIERLRKTNQLELNLEVNGERPEMLQTIVEVHLFRILQEFINNTLKYAKATQVTIHQQRRINEVWG